MSLAHPEAVQETRGGRRGVNKVAEGEIDTWMKSADNAVGARRTTGVDHTVDAWREKSAEIVVGARRTTRVDHEVDARSGRALTACSARGRGT